ncbi:MAG: hypothetical protein DMG16_16270 [Acidobacteria bacterium]|nr:MAG: hypothetical protein DMG16_16270 [Acidobacteriota bacterium]
MATRARQLNGTLEAAMAMLLQNQAALAKQHIEFLDRSDKRNAEMEKQTAEMQKRHAEMEKKHAEVMKELDVIKSVLARHEKILERLPETIRQKIGFKRE